MGLLPTPPNHGADDHQATRPCELYDANPQNRRHHQFPQPGLLGRRTRANDQDNEPSSSGVFRHSRGTSRGHPKWPPPCRAAPPVIDTWGFAVSEKRSGWRLHGLHGLRCWRRRSQLSETDPTAEQEAHRCSRPARAGEAETTMENLHQAQPGQAQAWFTTSAEGFRMFPPGLRRFWTGGTGGAFCGVPRSEVGV
jgi:hypothetical protein